MGFDFIPYGQRPDVFSLEEMKEIFASAFPALIGSTREKMDVLWVSLPLNRVEKFSALTGGLTDTLRQRSVSWGVYVKATPTLKVFLDGNCIYKGSWGENYYLEVTEAGWLFTKYNQIIGHRFLGKIDDALVDALFESIARQLPAFADAVLPRKPGERASKLRDKATLKDELTLLTVDGNTLSLPTRPLLHYAAIKVMLETAGGTYTRNAFVFEHDDAGDILRRLLAGEKVNPRKEHQFFPTPAHLAERICISAGVTQGVQVLEPQAGDGAIADQARRLGAIVTCIENWDRMAATLRDKGYTAVYGRDFLSMRPEETGLFDVVVCNPPFTRGQDITHVVHALQFVKPGGVVSAVMSTSWQIGSYRDQVRFRKLLEDAGATVSPIEAGTFAEAGTDIATVHVLIPVAEKPVQAESLKQLEFEV